MVGVAGSTPLMLASAAADPELVRLLIEWGGDVRLGTFGDSTPLLLAAGIANKMDRPNKQEYENAVEVAKFLVENGADVNFVGEKGWTALHGAAYVGADAMVQLLVDSGARLDVIDVFLQTPWSIAEGIIGAASKGVAEQPGGPHPSTAKLLLELGSDPLVVPELPAKYRQLSR